MKDQYRFLDTILERTYITVVQRRVRVCGSSGTRTATVRVGLGPVDELGVRMANLMMCEC